MAQKKLLLLLILVCTFCTESMAEDKFELRKEDMEFAKNLARKSRRFGMDAIKEKWLELNQMQASKQFALGEGDFNDIENPLAANTTLRVFVSSSMGSKLLKHYIAQAKRYNAILVFNGLPSNSWHKLSDLIYEITGGEAEETSIQLDDTVFDKYQIVSVPSFVLSRELNIFDAQEGQDEASEEEQFDKIVGNIGIKRALEEMSSRGELADEANQSLDVKRGWLKW